MPVRISSLILFCLVSGTHVFSAATLQQSDKLPEALRIATWNVEWFFDDFKQDNRSDLAKQQSAPSRAEFDWKKRQIARVIATMEPDIIALQEVENRDVVFQLTKELDSQFKVKYRYAFIDGFDFGTEQNVAILYKSGLVEYSRFEQTEYQFESDAYYSIGKHLFARFEWGEGKDKQELLVGTVHLRASDDNENLRVRQARLLKEWVRPKLEQNANVILLGDFNTAHSCETRNPKTDLGVLMGLDTSEKYDDLVSLNCGLQGIGRMTHMAQKEFDHILASPSLLEDRRGLRDLVFNGIVNRGDLVIVGTVDKDHRDNYYRINRDERDISDHYPIMAEFVVR